MGQLKPEVAEHAYTHVYTQLEAEVAELNRRHDEVDRCGTANTLTCITRMLAYSHTCMHPWFRKHMNTCTLTHLCPHAFTHARTNAHATRSRVG